jgi:two-component sensor histidine kinase/CheY-like chemotaxis protein
MPESVDRPIIHVLYVDDDVALVRLIQKVLGRRGFEVAHAPNAEAASAYLANHPVHVVALDHYLTTGTGLDFLGQIAHREGAPVVVYVTGSSEMNVAVAALKAGATDFVPKTVGDDFLILLASALEKAVEKSRLKMQREIAEKEVRAARDRAELLLAEVNHRVANSLALIASLVKLQAKVVTDESAKSALAETEARIYAIASVHRRLYSSGDVRFVALDEYLTGLLDHLQASMLAQAQGISLRYTIEPMSLPTDRSINLGMVVTEWITNAFKYAYPDGSGEIRVRVSKMPDNTGELIVEDDGVGTDSHGPVKGTGLGTRIVNAMAISMNAEVETAGQGPGTVMRLLFPLQPPSGQ